MPQWRITIAGPIILACSVVHQLSRFLFLVPRLEDFFVLGNWDFFKISGGLPRQGKPRSYFSEDRAPYKKQSLPGGAVIEIDLGGDGESCQKRRIRFRIVSEKDIPTRLDGKVGQQIWDHWAGSATRNKAEHRWRSVDELSSATFLPGLAGMGGW